MSGGSGVDGQPAAAIAIYDPSSATWQHAGQMSVARAGHTATALSDGRLLFAGGRTAQGLSNSAELFDAATGSSTAAGSLSLARADHAAARLADNRVLIVGGWDGSAALATLEILDPASGSASVLPVSLSTARTKLSATTLLDGHVLVAGGNDGVQDVAIAEIFDVSLQVVYPIATLSTPRSGHLAVLLPHNNTVLIAGGKSNGVALTSVERFVDWNATFAVDASPTTVERLGAVAVPTTRDGVLLVGGGGSADAEFYGFATLKTDKADYAPGEIVTFTGSGWQPGETVKLTVSEDADSHFDFEFTAVADEHGNIVNQEFFPREDDIYHHMGMRFYAVARGIASDAQTTFTDKGTLTITFAGNGSGLVTGSTASGKGGDFTGCTSSNGSCAVAFAQSDRVALTAAAASGSQFVGWSGEGCSGSGTCTVNVNADKSVTATFQKIVTDQTITFSPLGGKTYGDADFTVSATATSGLAVTFTAAGQCTVSGTTVGITAAGTCTITAHQNGNAQYNAAPDVSRSFTIDQATPVVTVNGGTYTYDTQAHPATATAAGVNGTSVSGSFTFTYNGGNAAPVNAGSYSVAASFTSTDANYKHATGTGSVVIDQATPVVNVTGGTYTYDTQAHPATATAAGVNGVNVAGSFTFTYNGGSDAPVNAGSYTVNASFTSSNANYKNATGTGSIVIDQATPVVTVNGGTYIYDTQPHPATAAAAGVNGVSVAGSFVFTYNGGSAVPVNAGSYAVEASFTSSDANYKNATGTGSVVIDQATPVVTVNGGTYVYDTQPHPATAAAAGVNGVSVAGSFVFTYNDGSDAPVNAGSYTVEAAFSSSDANYKNATGTGSIVIDQATPVVVVTGGSYVYDTQAHPATAAAAGVNGVSVAGSFVFTYNGGSAVPVNAGSYAVEASFTSSDANYKNATGTGSVVIDQATPVVTVNDGSYTYDTQAHPATATAAGVNGVSVTGSFVFTYNGGDAAPVNAGSYAVAASFTSTDANYKNATGTGTITIDQATPVVTVNGGTYTYDTQAHPATATAAGVNGSTVAGSFVFTYNGGSAVPVNAGSYAVNASFTSSDANYKNATGTGAIVINKASQTIVVTTPPPAHALYGTSFTVAAQGGASGNPVTFGAAGSCTNIDATFTLTSGYGTCTVSFAQAGNQNYHAADVVTQAVAADPWQVTGFYSPVNSSVLGTPVWNVVKGGSTVPLKFNIFAGVGGPEQTSLAAVKSLSLQPVYCTGGAAVEVPAEQLADTGGTSLRHDGSQFIQNWKTPKFPGSCFLVTMQAADTSTIRAYFQIK